VPRKGPLADAGHALAPAFGYNNAAKIATRTHQEELMLKDAG